MCFLQRNAGTKIIFPIDDVVGYDFDGAQGHSLSGVCGRHDMSKLLCQIMLRNKSDSRGGGGVKAEHNYSYSAGRKQLKSI